MAQIYTIHIYPYLATDFISAGCGTLYGNNFQYGILHDPRMQDNFVLSPKLEMQRCKAGSMTLVVTKENPFYRAMRNTFRWETAVFRENENGEKTFIWAGFPIMRETDIYGQTTFTLEGVLSYLNNTYIPAFDISNVLPSEFLYSVLQWHKRPIVCSYQGEETELFLAIKEHTTFGFGNCTDFDTAYQHKYAFTDDIGNEHYTIVSSENKIRRYTDKALSAMDVIQTRLVDYFGGNLYVTMNTNPNHEHYAIWDVNYKKLSEDNICAQSIQIGENATAIHFTADITDFCTALVPVDTSGNALCSYSTYGHDVSISDGNGNALAYCDAAGITFKNIALVSRFGVIASTLQLDDDVSTAEMTGETLRAASQLQNPSIDMEVMAQDLSFLNGSEDGVIKIGQRIAVYGNLGIETVSGIGSIRLSKTDPTYLYVEKLSLELDNPVNNVISLNGVPRTYTGK